MHCVLSAGYKCSNLVCQEMDYYFCSLTEKSPETADEEGKQGSLTLLCMDFTDCGLLFVVQFPVSSYTSMSYA